jgi:hypothetical protein
MNPIYFPYTYISAAVAEATAACFGRCAVYQPVSDQLPRSMQALVDKGIIDIRIPVAGGDRELVSAANNYLNWAVAHSGSSGSNLAFLKTLHASAPPVDDTLSFHLVADIKKQLNDNSGSKFQDQVRAARLFLYFAQEFDRQSHELDHDLTEFSQKEQAFIQDLKMEDDPLAAEFNREPARRPERNSDYLITGRLEAWTRILLKDTEPAGLFVTHSTAMLEQLLDKAPMARKILDIESIPQLTAAALAPAAWQERLVSYISDLAANIWKPDSEKKTQEFDIPAAENSVSLKIFLVPDQNAPHFFCRASGISWSEDDRPSRSASGRNTLVALVVP